MWRLWEGSRKGFCGSTRLRGPGTALRAVRKYPGPRVREFLDHHWLRPRNGCAGAVTGHLPVARSRIHLVDQLGPCGRNGGSVRVASTTATPRWWTTVASSSFPASSIRTSTVDKSTRSPAREHNRSRGCCGTSCTRPRCGSRTRTTPTRPRRSSWTPSWRPGPRRPACTPPRTRTRPTRFFAHAHERGLRMVAGKPLMDDGAESEGGPVPDGYLDESLEQAVADTWALIDRWHYNDRLRYCVAPRPRSSGSGCSPWPRSVMTGR
jgi:hypothetical protein